MPGFDNRGVDLRQDEEEVFSEPNPFGFDFAFDSFSPTHDPNVSFFMPDDYNTTFSFNFDPHSGSDNGDSVVDPNLFFCAGGGGEEDNDEQMNFISNLFEARIPGDQISESDSIPDEDPDPEFGFGPGLGSAEVPSIVGLRVAGIESESDSEEFDDVDSELVNNHDNNDDVGFNYYINESERALNEEYEWEAVNERIQFGGRENLNSVIDGIEEMNLNSTIDRTEEISVSSEISSSEEENIPLSNDGGHEEARNIDWAVLFRDSHLGRNSEMTNEEAYNNRNVFLNALDDYLLAMERDMQFVDYDTGLKFSPPAAKSVVENLPSVPLTKEETGANDNVVFCAVCNDEVAIGEKVTRLPCTHLYHGDCILPWLRIRNTCPICRYGLPTDNVGYEKMRNNHRITVSFLNALRARYNELLP